MANLIRERQSQNQNCVFGLATGSTPVGVYAELARMHQEDGLSFENVISFNLDEYFPMERHELQSYRRFMQEHLFDLVDIDPANVHVPDGSISLEEVSEYCEQYEAKIARAGGIDIQLLGIGRTGHVGFNEPGSDAASRTRLITLDHVTRTDAASDFFGVEHVPRRALTMGVGTILDAKRIFMIAFGEHKADVIARAIEGEMTSSIPATYLQNHGNACVMLDNAAAASLTRMKCPWVLQPIKWDDATIRKAVIWLARRLDKAVLKLTNSDYNEEHLQDLLVEYGSAYDINLKVFRHLQSTITGWPGGKPDHAKLPGDHDREHDRIFPKRVLVFSPHPDDDVISMGGTLIRLVDQGHEVHVAYQTSGNIAVFDDDAIRHADFLAECCRDLGVKSELVDGLEAHVEEFLKNKRAGQIDSKEIRNLKTLIRKSEAKAAARDCGVLAERLYFLNMPFYESGRVKKKDMTQEDIDIVVELLRSVRPHQVYAAGDLSDPHGTHRTCLTAILQAIRQCHDDEWRADCDVWLYRGAWQEWSPEQIEMAVPLSPQEVEQKRAAIFKHESQKDRALFPGPDVREFWQRAQQRNAANCPAI